MNSSDNELCKQVKSLEGYFYHRIQKICNHRNFRASDAALWYLVNTLVIFGSKGFGNQMASGERYLPTLAQIYRRALESTDEISRQRSLKKLGDFALIIAGFFTQAIYRRNVDLDYYVGMGGNAYGYLSNNSHNDSAHSDVFGELADHFLGFVDLLAEVKGNQRQGHQLLRIYEAWQLTGSPVAEDRLRQAGILPLPSKATGFVH